MTDADGTPNKSNLGANAILAVSLAAARAGADEADLPLYRFLGGPMARVLPVPMMNILNGGAHASNNVDAQEFMIVPVGADDFPHALQMGVEVFHALRKVLTAKKLSTAVGDEGGFAPMLPSNEAALDAVMEAIEKAGFKLPVRRLRSPLDPAASEFYKDGVYTFQRRAMGRSAVRRRDGRVVSGVDAWQVLRSRVDRGRPWPKTTGNGWEAAHRCAMGDTCQLVGDDLFVTNVERLGPMASRRAAAMPC